MTNPLTAFSWSPSGQPNITPLVWIDHHQTPQQAADAAIPALLARPAGQRAIFHWYPMLIDATRTAWSTFPTPNIAPAVDWTRRFYQHLNLANCIPDFIWCDEEGAPNYWNSPQYTNKIAGFSPSDFADGSPKQRGAILAYGAWCASINGPALKRVVLDTAAAAFGVTPPASNYGDSFSSSQLFDPNGWPIPRDNRTLQSWSSPAPYLNLQNSGNRYTMGGFKKHPLWNRFADNLNACRSVLMAGMPLAPWVSYASYAGDGVAPSAGCRWLWGEMVKHAYANGVTTFLYWNPPGSGATAKPADDDAFAGALLAELATKPTKRLKLGEIPMDADSVATGGRVTTYGDFQKHFPIKQPPLPME